jgi:hypothetical protein
MRWAAVLALVLFGFNLAWAKPAPVTAPEEVGATEAEPAPPPRTPEEWQAIAQQNLDAMRDLLIAHTPIALPGGDAQQQAWLETGYNEALALIPRVRDDLGVLYVLRRYAIGFDDIHLTVHQDGPPTPTTWPGFLAARRGSDTVVHWRAADAPPGQPPVGAIIESCDGQAIEALIEAGLFRFWRSPGVSRGYLQATMRLFIDNGSGFFPPPQSCVMAWDGATREVPLQWQPVDLQGGAISAALLAADGQTEAVWGITDPAPDVTWIGVPSFMDPYTMAFPPQLSQIVNQLERQRTRYRRGGAIVVDLRGNGGGLVGGAHDLARGIFGPAAERRGGALFMRTLTVFRISPANVDFLTDRMGEAEALRPMGEDFPIFSWMFQGALRDGRDSLTIGPLQERPTEGLTRQRVGAIPPAAEDGARIFVLFNETCLSACLIFLDIAAFQPGVTLIGGVSGADGALTFSRELELPEPGFWLSAPMVENRGAPRGAGEAYTPDIAYPGVWADDDVRAWVLDLIAQGRSAN